MENQKTVWTPRAQDISAQGTKLREKEERRYAGGDVHVLLIASELITARLPHHLADN